MGVKERLREFIKYKKISERTFCREIGVSMSYVNSIRTGIQPDKMKVIVEKYPELNPMWLLTGEGEMLFKKDFQDTENTEAADFVPLLPISAQAGSLSDFLVSVKDSECETIISPVKDIDFAIRVTGDSMYPEYPSGSIILIKKINEALFIEWGKTYVLDTSNGIVVKEIHKGDNDDEIKCVSINKDPKFHPFSIKLKDIFGMYRVVMCLSMK